MAKAALLLNYAKAANVPAAEIKKLEETLATSGSQVTLPESWNTMPALTAVLADLESRFQSGFASVASAGRNEAALTGVGDNAKVVIPTGFKLGDD